MQDILQEFEISYGSPTFKLDDRLAFCLSWPSVSKKKRTSVNLEKSEVSIAGLIKSKDKNYPIKTKTVTCVVNNTLPNPACPPYITGANIHYITYLYTIHAHYYGEQTMFSEFDMERYQPNIQNKHLLYVWWILKNTKPLLPIEISWIIFVEYILLISSI